jgi:hypothetical protein
MSQVNIVDFNVTQSDLNSVKNFSVYSTQQNQSLFQGKVGFQNEKTIIIDSIEVSDAVKLLPDWREPNFKRAFMDFIKIFTIGKPFTFDEFATLLSKVQESLETDQVVFLVQGVGTVSPEIVSGLGLVLGSDFFQDL